MPPGRQGPRDRTTGPAIVAPKNGHFCPWTAHGRQSKGYSPTGIRHQRRNQGQPMSVAQFVEFVLFHPEVVGNLMQDRDSHLLPELFGIFKILDQAAGEKSDFVGKRG